MKQKTVAILALLVISWACKDKTAKSTVVNTAPEVRTDTTLLTDSSWGLVTKNTDYAGLQAIYGRSNVQDMRVCGPECEDSIDVTVIYPETNKQITVHWKDSAYHKTIVFMETWFPDGPYHTADGLKIGTPLKDLLQLNGQKITFSGFGWDYGGFIQSYNKGKFENSAIRFQLGQTEDAGTELSGDMEINTDMPEVKKYMDKIQISYLSLSFSSDPQ